MTSWPAGSMERPMAERTTYGTVATRVGTELVRGMSEETLAALVERWRRSGLDPEQIDAIVSKVALEAKRGARALEAIHDAVGRAVKQSQRMLSSKERSTQARSCRWSEELGRELSDEEIAQNYEAMALEHPQFAAVLHRRAERVRKHGAESIWGHQGQNVLGFNDDRA